MKHELTLHYSVQNGGDGSAYPQFMESEALAEFDQDHMSEGWGESCTGSITLRSDSPIEVVDEIYTAAYFLLNLIDYDGEDCIEEFVEEFFPNGFPEFSVISEPAAHNPKINVLKIYADGKLQKTDYGDETPEQKLAEINTALEALKK
jgi:hypothetical protein